jgi:hypothetical protein
MTEADAALHAVWPEVFGDGGPQGSCADLLR